MTTSNYIHPKAASSTFEFELFRVEALLNSMLDFFHVFESEEMKEEDFNESLKNIALVLNPALSEVEAKECASVPILTLAFNQASDLTSRVIAAWKLQEDIPRDDMEKLLFESSKMKTGDNKSDESAIIKELPWILSDALARICHGGTVTNEPTSQVAVGARILACVVEKLRTMPELNQEPA